MLSATIVCQLLTHLCGGQKRGPRTPRLAPRSEHCSLYRLSRPLRACFALCYIPICGAHFTKRPICSAHFTKRPILGSRVPHSGVVTGCYPTSRRGTGCDFRIKSNEV